MTSTGAASTVASGAEVAIATLAVHALIAWQSALAGWPQGECSGAGAGVSCTAAGAAGISIAVIACALACIPSSHAPDRPASGSWRAKVAETSSATIG